MSFEELSAATASLHADRMKHDVVSTPRRINPPHMDMPVSARNETYASARVVEPDVATPETYEAPDASAGITDPMRTAQDITSSVDAVYDNLAVLLTHKERRRIRSALCTSVRMRSLHADPMLAVTMAALTAGMVGVLVGAALSSQAPRSYRSVHTPTAVKVASERLMSLRRH